MIRILLAAAALAVLPWLAPRPAHAQSDEQTLVDRSTLALQDMVNQSLSDDPRRMLGRARAVMICPRVFKAGFFFGGEGGACVLLARAGNGTWSYPAFYGMGSGSFGFQIGIQDAQFVMMIMTEKGLRAVLDSQFKLGADASLAIATIGAGIQGSTTAALGADIIAFSQTRGLYGGVSIEGSLMGQRSEANRAYYGHDMGDAADRHRHAGVQSRGRSAARRADALRHRRSEAGRGAGDGLSAAAGRPPAPTQLQPRGQCSSRPCRRRSSRRAGAGVSLQHHCGALAAARAGRLPTGLRLRSRQGHPGAARSQEAGVFAVPVSVNGRMTKHGARHWLQRQTCSQMRRPNV